MTLRSIYESICYDVQRSVYIGKYMSLDYKYTTVVASNVWKGCIGYIVTIDYIKYRVASVHCLPPCLNVSMLCMGSAGVKALYNMPSWSNTILRSLRKPLLLCCVNIYFVRYRHSVRTECSEICTYHESQLFVTFFGCEPCYDHWKAPQSAPSTKSIRKEAESMKYVETKYNIVS